MCWPAVTRVVWTEKLIHRQKVWFATLFSLLKVGVYTLLNLSNIIYIYIYIYISCLYMVVSLWFCKHRLCVCVCGCDDCFMLCCRFYDTKLLRAVSLRLRWPQHLSSCQSNILSRVITSLALLTFQPTLVDQHTHYTQRDHLSFSSMLPLSYTRD